MGEVEQTQRLAAILAADAVGYSRLMEADERTTLAALDAARAAFLTATKANHGHVVNTAGDSVLAVFDSAAGAVTAALAAQGAIEQAAAAAPADRRLRFRIGVHLGDVTYGASGDAHGDGVNIAARLQALAEPGGIVVSEGVRGAVKQRIPAVFEDLGSPRVKNIAERVRAFAVRTQVADGARAWRRRAVPRSVWYGAGALAVATAGAVVVAWLHPWTAPPASLPTPAAEVVAPPVVGKPSIAVLPFDNMSGDPQQAYFADGITEDLITDLSKVGGLFVIARNSTFAYKAKARDIREIGKALGARYVLEGSVRKSGDSVRVNAQLIDAASGGHVWADRYDGDLRNIFSVQDRIARSVAKALSVELTKDESANVANRGTANVQAYDVFLEEAGSTTSGRRRKNFAAAVAGFQACGRHGSRIQPRLRGARGGPLGRLHAILGNAGHRGCQHARRRALARLAGHALRCGAIPRQGHEGADGTRARGGERDARLLGPARRCDHRGPASRGERPERRRGLTSPSRGPCPSRGAQPKPWTRSTRRCGSIRITPRATSYQRGLAQFALDRAARRPALARARGRRESRRLLVAAAAAGRLWPGRGRARRGTAPH